MLILGEYIFHKYSNSLKNFQTVFFSATVLPPVRVSAMLDHVGGVKAQKPPRKGYFVDGELVRKTLEILNLKPQILY